MTYDRQFPAEIGLVAVRPGIRQMSAAETSGIGSRRRRPAGGASWRHHRRRNRLPMTSAWCHGRARNIVELRSPTAGSCRCNSSDQAYTRRWAGWLSELRRRPGVTWSSSLRLRPNTGGTQTCWEGLPLPTGDGRPMCSAQLARNCRRLSSSREPVVARTTPFSDLQRSLAAACSTIHIEVRTWQATSSQSINQSQSCIVFFLEKLFLPMHSGADDIIVNLLAKLRI